MLALRVPGLAFILMIYIASIVLQFVSGGGPFYCFMRLPY